MAVPLPSYVHTGLVKGKQGVISSDTSADVDTAPDAAWAVGATLTFSPSVTYLLFHPEDAAPDGATWYLFTITATVNASGDLVTADGAVLYLPANLGQPFNDEDWFWTCQPKVNGTRLEAFRFDVTADVTNYLANQQPIPATTIGSAIVRGPEGPDGPPGLGIPVGGTVGQVVVKASSTDYDANWGTGVPSPDARIVDESGSHVRIGAPWSMGDRSKDFDWDPEQPGGPKLMTPNAVTPESSTFARTTPDDNGMAWQASSRGGTQRYFGYGQDRRMHAYEFPPLLVVGDSMAGVSALNAAKVKLATATQHPLIDGATSGDWEQWMAARLGAIPAGVKVLDGRSTSGPSGVGPNCGTIASTGAVNMQVSPQLGATVKDYFGWIGPVFGVFTPTELPGSPDPQAANDPGSIAYNYGTGVFRRIDQGGPIHVIPDGTPFLTGYSRNEGKWFRNMWLIRQPSRHNFYRRYQRVTPSGTAGTVTFAYGLTGRPVGPVAWDPADPTALAATMTASTDRVAITAHGLSVRDAVSFTSVTGAAGITAGIVYFVRSVVDANTVTLTTVPGGSLLDITTNGTGTTATTATQLFASKLAAAINTALTSWAGLVDVLTGLPGETSTIGQVQVDWDPADTAKPLTLIRTTGGATATCKHLRDGIDDTIDGIEASLDMLTIDAREKSVVPDLGPFPGSGSNPGEVAGTAKRDRLDLGNARLAEAFPRQFYPVWALMRNADFIRRIVAGTALDGVSPTTADLTAIQSTRMTPPTFTDTGGYTPVGSSSGGHPGPVGGDAWFTLLMDRWNAQPASWHEKVW